MKTKEHVAEHGPAAPPLRVMRGLPALTISVSLAVSAGIHASIVNAHLQEWWVAGVFFVGAAVAQAWCAYVVLHTLSMRVAGLGSIVSIVLIAAWVLSRSIGLPFGPDAAEREAIAVLDVVATAAEVITVGAMLTALRATRLRRHPSHRSSRALAVATVAMTFGLGTATAAALPPHAHELDHMDDSHHDVVRSASTGPRRTPGSTETPALSEHSHEEEHSREQEHSHADDS